MQVRVFIDHSVIEVFVIKQQVGAHSTRLPNLGGQHWCVHLGCGHSSTN